MVNDGAKKLKKINLRQKNMIFNLIKRLDKSDAVIGWSDNLRKKDLFFEKPVYFNCIVLHD
jgi:hypothetical protein